MGGAFSRGDEASPKILHRQFFNNKVYIYIISVGCRNLVAQHWSVQLGEKKGFVHSGLLVQGRCSLLAVDIFHGLSQDCTANTHSGVSSPKCGFVHWPAIVSKYLGSCRHAFSVKYAKNKGKNERACFGMHLHIYLNFHLCVSVWSVHIYIYMYISVCVRVTLVV